MSESVNVIGLVILPRDDVAAAMPVIAHVIDRMRRIPGGGDVTVVTDAEVELSVDAKVVRTESPMQLPGRIARAWSATTWRGGIGGATVYDEIIDPAALTKVMRQLNAGAALIVGATWPLINIDLCGQLIARHAENPAEFKLVFTQAPPGFAGVVVTVELMEQMATDHSSIGHMLDYNPTHPQGDPIARDICVQITPGLRQANVRAIAGAKRWEALMPLDSQADAETVAVQMANTLDQRGHAQPVMATIELTTRRYTTGPLHIVAERPDMTVEHAGSLFAELAEIDDVAVMFGGAGDPLCHPQWSSLIGMVRQAGIQAIAVETDLLVEPPEVDLLLSLDVDVIKVRLNADSKTIYQEMMGVDAFERVIGNVQRLLQHRMQHGKRPWVVPTMMKTKQNVTELENFVDRWTYYAGAALIEPPSQAMAHKAVIDMAPPRRFPCRQLMQRMTILSDGRIAPCDQSAHGMDCRSVAEGWKRIGALREAHREGRYEGICQTCRQWHRP